MPKRLGLSFLIWAAPLAAGFIPSLRMEDLARAPLVAVGRVESVRPGAAVPAGELRWTRPTARCRAVVAVLRSLPPRPAESLGLDFYCDPSSSRGVPGGVAGGPVFPRFAAGEVHLFGLTPAGTGWRLVAEDGFGLTAPAVEAPLPGRPPAFSARDFVVRELVNGLTRGSYADLCRYGYYLREAAGEEQARELLRHLRQNLAANDGRWIELAGAMLAGMGIPRPSLEALMSAPRGALAVLAAGALERIPEARRPEALIRQMLRRSGEHDWGAAATLVPEFKDHPALLSLLPCYLERRQRGALYTAWWLSRNGQTLLDRPAVEAALAALSEAKPGSNDFHAACSLLVDRGTEGQFAVFLHALRSARERDPQRYMALWNGAFGLANPRMARVCGVLLEDERVVFGDVRYCDVAVGYLQQIAGESFGFDAGNRDRAARNAALRRARVWLAQHPRGRPR